MTEMEKQFHRAMVSLDRRALWECGYNASRSRKMLGEHGGLKTAKILLQNPKIQYGFVELWERKRLDLTVESLILTSPWDTLFSDEEKAIARWRLKEHGYNPDVAACRRGPGCDPTLPAAPAT